MRKSVLLMLVFSFIFFSVFSTVGFESYKSADLEIGEITGGIGRVQVEIKNLGDDYASNIVWQISVRSHPDAKKQGTHKNSRQLGERKHCFIKNR